MHITSLLNERSVTIDLEAGTKEEVLEKMIVMLGKSPKNLDAAQVRRAVLDREAMATTGIGEGVAIPHAKTGAVSDIMAALAILRDPVDFRALDDQPVRIVFLLVGLDSRVGTYLKLLSRIRRLITSASFRKRLLQATTPVEVIQTFREEEERYFEMA
ncbi:MAG: PTS sugar transporter subunit IIA [Ignavibacteriae bacterium]|nr:PTS sugar transporter subunit IIA [Ignavibacteriota bacterium]MCB9217417.1 PTS sugar transporter subunit IIA [Ignavibacteria bacterium]